MSQRDRGGRNEGGPLAVDEGAPRIFTPSPANKKERALRLSLLLYTLAKYSIHAPLSHWRFSAMGKQAKTSFKAIAKKPPAALGRNLFQNFEPIITRSWPAVNTFLLNFWRECEKFV